MSLIPVLLGGTGLVGGHLARRLLADPRVTRLRALGRRPLDLDHPKLDQQRVDLDALTPELLAGDALLCCLGTTHAKAGSREAFRRVDFDAPLAAARMALAAGARQVQLVSSVGANPRSPLHYARVKGEVEQAILALGAPSTVILRPTQLLGERAERRPLEAVGEAISRLASPLLVGPLAGLGPIDADTVAAAMQAALFAPPSGARVLEANDIRSLADQAGMDY